MAADSPTRFLEYYSGYKIDFTVEKIRLQHGLKRLSPLTNCENSKLGQYLGEDGMANFITADSSYNLIDLDAPVFLRPESKIEPRFCGWAAWPHLIAPIPCAMNMAFRYLPLLQSFASNPSVHVAATKDPRLFGGPFVQLPSSEVPKVKALIADTKQKLTRMLALAEAIKVFNAKLQDEAKGFSLNEFYAQLPLPLQGLVELSYDTNNHPRINYLEHLFYEEFTADMTKNQDVALSMTRESDRPFSMSTPYLSSNSELLLGVPFADPSVDILSDMRFQPKDLRTVVAALPGSLATAQIAKFFTTSAPQRNVQGVSGDSLQVRYFGHACVMLRTRDTTLLIDPVFAVDPTDGTGEDRTPRMTIADIPDWVDFVILTHCHQDHFSIETLLQLRSRVGCVIVPAHNAGNIADPSMKLILEQLGFSRIIVMNQFDQFSLDDGQIISLPFLGEHSDLDIHTKQCLYISIRGRTLLFLADSDCWDRDLYRRMAAKLSISVAQPVDALFIGMECHGAPLNWLYGPLLTRAVSRRDGESRRLSGANCERARAIIQNFPSSHVYVYAMGQEPWLKHLMGLQYVSNSIQLLESERFVNYCRSTGVISERLYGAKDILI